MSFRRDTITKPIFSWARGVLPAMSDTEREALEAWWHAITAVDAQPRNGSHLTVCEILK